MFSIKNKQLYYNDNLVNSDGFHISHICGDALYVKSIELNMMMKFYIPAIDPLLSLKEQENNGFHILPDVVHAGSGKSIFCNWDEIKEKLCDEEQVEIIDSGISNNMVDFLKKVEQK